MSHKWRMWSLSYLLQHIWMTTQALRSTSQSQVIASPLLILLLCKDPTYFDRGRCRYTLYSPEAWHLFLVTKHVKSYYFVADSHAWCIHRCFPPYSAIHVLTKADTDTESLYVFERQFLIFLGIKHIKPHLVAVDHVAWCFVHRCLFPYFVAFDRNCKMEGLARSIIWILSFMNDLALHNIIANYIN